MVNIHLIKAVYFVGIGGIGMSALARYFLHRGLYVAGYDRTRTPLTDQLRDEHIHISFSEEPNDLPALFKTYTKDRILIVYTPAVPKENELLSYFRANEYNIRKRAEVLGMITENLSTIAVAGTHGKTSVSVMIAWIMKNTSVKTAAFIGGISRNLNSNLMLPEDKYKIELVVAEADEFDRSFLYLKPDTAIITSIDPDHLDIYQSKQNLQDTFVQFAEKLHPNGTLIIKKSVPLALSQKPKEFYMYALEEKADFSAVNLRQSPAHSTFDLIHPNGTISNIRLNVPGRLHVENAVAAAAAALLNGAEESQIRTALGSWEGTRRRFEYIINHEDLVFISDYAHHPAELNALINSVKELYPDKQITGAFQPHLYSRTRDFAREFGEELSRLDRVLLTPVYPAREEPIEGVSSDIIFDNIDNENKYQISKEEIPEYVSEHRPEVLLLIGAGDIVNMSESIKEALLK